MKKIKCTKKEIQNLILLALRLVFFVLFPAIFSTAFAGVKYIFQQIGTGEMLTTNPFVITLIAVCVFTILFGRFFCGFACAFGTYGDVVYWISAKIRKKRKKRAHSIPVNIAKYLRYLKYVILIGILLLCFFQRPEVVSANSPWTVFSLIQSLKRPELGAGILLLVLITVGMYFEKRFFCRFLCPMGAVFSLLPIIPFSGVKRDRENCIKGCRGCQMKCPAGIEIATVNEGDNLMMGECFSCGKCGETCPKENIRMGFVKEKNQLFYWHLFRGILLLLLCYLLTGGIS